MLTLQLTLTMGGCSWKDSIFEGPVKKCRESCVISNTIGSPANGCVIACQAGQGKR